MLRHETGADDDARAVGAEEEELDEVLEEIEDEGPMLDPEQEEDITQVLNDCDWTLSSASALASNLSQELEVLDQTNVLAILDSEIQVDEVMDQLDLAIDALDRVQARMEEYKGEIEPIQAQVKVVAGMESNVDTRYENETRLLQQVDELVKVLDLPSELEEAMRGGDLSDPRVVRACTEGVGRLVQQDIGQLSDTLQQLDVVKARKAQFAALQLAFADRFVDFIITLLGRLVEKGSGISDAARKQFLEQYAEMVQWLKGVEASSEFSQYATLCGTYAKNLNMVYRVHAASACDACQGALGPVRKPTKSASIAETGDLDARLGFDGAFEALLGKLVPFLLTELEFAQRFLLDSPGVAGPGAAELGAAGAEDGADTAARASASVVSERNASSDALLGKLFGGIDVKLMGLVEAATKVDPFYALSMMVRLESYQSTIPASAHALKKILAAALVGAKRGFDDFKQRWQQHIAEAKTPHRKKIGILPFIDEFSGLAKQIEAHLKAAECTRRAVVDRALVSLAGTVVATIERIADECKHRDVVLFENFHRLWDHLSHLKVDCLKACRSVCQEKYRENLNIHVQTTLGRPLPLLSSFFGQLEQVIQSGTPAAEVGFQVRYSKQELRKLIAQYPGKVVKKALEDIYKRVDRQVSEEEKQPVWHQMQVEFAKQYKRFEELIDLCYPGSGISLGFKVQELVDYFAAVAGANA